MFYLMMHSTHFIYGYMASDIMVKDHSDSERGNPLPLHELSFRLAARFFLYASSHRKDNTYHVICYTSSGALAEMIGCFKYNISMLSCCKLTKYNNDISKKKCCQYYDDNHN